MLQKLRNNKKGFTLIELMIVIAIIGILAAIAIPNFIAYRDKAFCGQAEHDAQNTLASLSSYYADPAGTSKMKAFRHGWKLMRVCWQGLRMLP